MKYFLLIAAAFIIDLASAATYEWRGVRVVNGEIWETPVKLYNFYGYVYSGVQYCADTEGPLEGYKKGSAFYLRQQDHKTTQQPVDNNVWIVAYCGELLNADAFAAADSIPLSDWYDETTSNGQFVSDENEFYLAFKTAGDNIQDDIVRYGWFYVALNDELEMSILDSGIGLYGESVYVGGLIPEPSSGLLLLLGIASLALRRKRAVS